MSDENAEAAEARAQMEVAERMLIAGVERLGAAWVVAAVRRILDAWGRADDATRNHALADAASAGEQAAVRVSSELRGLFQVPVAEQRATPLEVIRSLRREATEVLESAGVPSVVRDVYDERAFPDDIYGIVPHSPNDLGDDQLGGALLAWGLGKAKVLRRS